LACFLRFYPSHVIWRAPTQNFKFLEIWSDWAEIRNVGPVWPKNVPNQNSDFYLNPTTFGEGLKLNTTRIQLEWAEREVEYN